MSTCLRCLAPFLAFLALAAAEPRAFHVDDAGGDDARDGLAPERAWRTLDRVNRAALAPGDRVLFRRGGLWRGQLRPQSGDATGVITYAAYGTGAKPLLLGSASMGRPADWLPEGPGLWTTAPIAFTPTDPIADLRGVPWSIHTEGGAAATLAPLPPDDTGRGGFRLVCRQPGAAGNHIQIIAPMAFSAPPAAQGLLTVALKASGACTLGTIGTIAISTRGAPWTGFGSGTLVTGPIGTAWAEHRIHIPLKTVPDNAGPLRIAFMLGGVLPPDTTLECRLGLLTGAVCNQPIPLSVDVGNIVFDDGASVGIKKWSLAQLTRDGDYWYDQERRRVVLRATANPGASHQRIELALNRHVIDQGGRHHVTYQDLALSLGAAHGIGGGTTSHITVRDCDISWMGGGHQFTGKDGRPVRFGNGVEFWSEARHCLVEGCRIWEIYDAALTNQGNGTNVEEDITYRRNVIWNSEYSFEYWNRDAGSLTRDIVFEHNTCVDAGYGWGHGQRPDPNGRHLMFYDNTARTERVTIRHNIFSRARHSLLRLHGREWTAALTMDDNVWFQDQGPWLLWGKDTCDAATAQVLLRSRGFDARSLFSEPRFVDAAARDYRLLPDSPARALRDDTGPVGALP